MSDDRISRLADAIASALVAGDVEQYRSLVECMSEQERDRAIAHTVLHADLATAQRILQAAPLEEREEVAPLVGQVLEDLDLEIKILDLPGSGGPFLFRTDEELLRVVRTCVRRAFIELPYTSETGPLKPLSSDPDASEADLKTLLSEAEKIAESELLHDRLTAVVLYTGWTPKLGRKTHAAVIPFPSELDSARLDGTRLETLCGRGWGTYSYFSMHQLQVLDSVDCPGCWNALALGGFLKNSPQVDSDWLLPARKRRAEVLARRATRGEAEGRAHEEVRERELHAAVERDLADIRQGLNDSG